MENRTINDLPIFQYLFGLNNRNLPQSILRFYDKIENVITNEKETAINKLSDLKNNCRKLVVFSRTFIEMMDKTYMKFADFHTKLLDTLDDENGIVKSPYFLDESYVVYRIERGHLMLWVFSHRMDKYLSIPTFYIYVSKADAKNKDGYKIEIDILPLVDFCYEVNLNDYVYTVLDYLCLREWAEVELGNVSTIVRREVRDKKKIKVITEPGLEYHKFDSKWYTEINHGEMFIVSGHFRLQHYKDGTSRIIWIDAFVKHGYHRKATIDKVKDGEVILT